ncbi:hypothetical protein ACLB2K_059731 [Fragaria x ananassa]
MDYSDDDYDEDYVEKDPQERFFRSNEVLGVGSCKTVYKAFDELEGIEVAWSQVILDDVQNSPTIKLESFYSEVDLLKSLKHENIIKIFSWWVDDKNKTLNVVTELFTSGSLRQYRDRHRHVDIKAIKKWARQILQGLYYMHSHQPPIIHRDLKCDNIFVNGSNSEIKIGDFRCATVMKEPTCLDVVGTPEFMAPELFDDEYNELVDIYAFSMCMLEMVTCEKPYRECKTPGQVYNKKVISGIKPASLDKVSDPQVKQFIEKCLAPESMRVSVMDLLHDPFLAVEYLKKKKISEFQGHPMEIDIHYQKHYPASTRKSVDATFSSSSESSTLELQRSTENNGFSLREENNELGSSCEAQRGGRWRKNIEFEFHLDSDTASEIAQEMVEQQLDLSNEEVSVISDLVDDTIMELVPTWNPKSKGANSSFEGHNLLEHDSGDSSLCSLPQFSLLDKYQYYRLKMELSPLIRCIINTFLSC